MADTEIIDFYVEATRLPRIVITAFVNAGIEPPDRARVDRIGYSAAERRLIAPYLSTPEA
jgi:hypothetical protein